MDDMVNWYGRKGPASPIAGDLSQCLIQDDGVHLVLTGGEPLLKGFQQGVFDLMTHPDLKTRFVTIETNGTQIFSPYDYCNDGYMFPDHHRKFGVNKNAGMTFSVSPKLSNSGEAWTEAIRPEALASYNAWPHSYLYLKFVVKDEHDVEEVHDAVREYDHARVNIDAIYLMPEGGTDFELKQNDYNVAQLALKYGYKYSPRLHINLFGNEWGT
jgi:7-carboxy-7-deazaguanine synthase